MKVTPELLHVARIVNRSVKNKTIDDALSKLPNGNPAILKNQRYQELFESRRRLSAAKRKAEEAVRELEEAEESQRQSVFKFIEDLNFYWTNKQIAKSFSDSP